jgi:hypothetical protein
MEYVVVGSLCCAAVSTALLVGMAWSMRKMFKSFEW